MKKVIKFRAGEIIPDGAKFLFHKEEYFVTRTEQRPTIRLRPPTPSRVVEQGQAEPAGYYETVFFYEVTSNYNGASTGGNV